MQRSKIIRNICLGVENLMLHKLRTFLTMLGVVFGVGSVVAMLSVGEGASQEALNQIKKIGSNNIIINSIHIMFIVVIIPIPVINMLIIIIIFFNPHECYLV